MKPKWQNEGWFHAITSHADVFVFRLHLNTVDWTGRSNQSLSDVRQKHFQIFANVKDARANKKFKKNNFQTGTHARVRIAMEAFPTIDSVLLMLYYSYGKKPIMGCVLNIKLSNCGGITNMCIFDEEPWNHCKPEANRIWQKSKKEKKGKADTVKILNYYATCWIRQHFHDAQTQLSEYLEEIYFRHISIRGFI